MSRVASLDLGGVVVDVLCDALADHPRALADAFPGAPAAGWDAVRAAFPETVGVDGRWRFGTHVVLVRTGGATVLIDTGVGPAGSAAARWLDVTGTLDADLAELGVSLEDIDVVVLTHLHQDHVGWLPRLRRARVVVSGAEWASGAQRPTLAGRLDIDGDLVDGLRLLPLPGHTPGHSGVLIGERLLFAGDAFNHPLQITDPGVPSGADGDPAQAVATRHAVIALARDDGLTVLGAHLPGAVWPDADLR